VTDVDPDFTDLADRAYDEMVTAEQKPPYDPRTAQPICPHCDRPLLNTGWRLDTQYGMTTIFHAEEHCNRVITVQIRAEDRQQQLLVPPSGRRH